MSKNVVFNIKLKIDGVDHVVTASTNTEELARQLGIAKSNSDKLRQSLLHFNQVTQALQNLTSGLSQIAGVTRQYTDANKVQIEAETKLATAMRNAMDATDADIQSIKDLCSAQQQLGIIGDEVQLAGAQELATYLGLKSSLESLIPVMNDMIAQQYGIGASGESAVTIATMLGKVMNGQTTALRKLGYSFDETQEQVLKFGTEEQRAAVLAEVVEASVRGMNAELANTDAGKAQQAANNFGDLKEKIGALIGPLETTIVQVGEMGLAFNAIATTFGVVFPLAKIHI